MSQPLGMDEPWQGLGRRMSGLGVRYDSRRGGSCSAAQMPDLDLITTDGQLRFDTLLHDAHPVLL